MAKKKPDTKGQKKILEENNSTLRFYIQLSVGVTVAYVVVNFLCLRLFTTWYLMMFILCTAIYYGCYSFMKYMVTPKFGENGQLLDAGIDLNMEGGISEHVKDLVILTAGCELSSLLSNWAWFLWLLAPIRALWLVWVNIIGPYMQQQQQPSQQANPLDVSERKQKRMERKIKRSGR